VVPQRDIGSDQGHWWFANPRNVRLEDGAVAGDGFRRSNVFG